MATSTLSSPRRLKPWLALSTLCGVVALEPSFVLRRDVDAVAADLEAAHAAFDHSPWRTTARRQGDADLRCAALERYAMAMRDDVPVPGAAPVTCDNHPGGASTPAPFDRLGHARDVFLGGPMRVLPLPDPPDVTPVYRA